MAHPLRVGLHLAVDRVAEVGDGEGLVEVGVSEARAAGLPPELRFFMPERWGTNAAVSISAPTRRTTRCRVRPSRRRGRRLTLRRRDQPEQHAQAGGLARAVRAEQPADLPLLDLEAQVVDREHAFAELLREARDATTAPSSKALTTRRS